MASEIKRQTAYIVSLADILALPFVKSEKEFEPNYLLTIDNLKLSRVNIVGVVVDKEENNASSQITFEDGTGTIILRGFEKDNLLKDVMIGDVLLIIGKPREFNRQKYLVPEIVKKITNNKWVEYRKIELAQSKKVFSSTAISTTPPLSSQTRAKETPPLNEELEIVEEEIIDDHKNEEKNSPYYTILSTIRTLDQGQGADIDLVVAQAAIQNAETIIKRLVEEGELFEIKPGKLKILE